MSISDKQINILIDLMGDVFSYEIGEEDLKKCKEEFYLVLSEYKIERNHISTMGKICNIFEKWGADEDDLKIQYYSNDKNGKKLIKFLNDLVDTN